jgi:hypothetical protein
MPSSILLPLDPLRPARSRTGRVVPCPSPAPSLSLRNQSQSSLPLTTLARLSSGMGVFRGQRRSMLSMA